MSENSVSAFAAYRSMKTKSNTNKKKTKQKLKIGTSKETSKNAFLTSKAPKLNGKHGPKRRKKPLVVPVIDSEVIPAKRLKPIENGFVDSLSVDSLPSSTAASGSLEDSELAVEIWKEPEELGKTPKSTSTPESATVNEDETSENENPFMQAHKVFSWVIAPLNVSEFFEKFWEKSPAHIKRNKPQYYRKTFNSEEMDKMFRKNSLHYTRNVDIVSYKDGKRETHNIEGRAVPSALWDYYANGCSIRVLNPHTYCQKLHVLLATLQEYFGCMAGANVYLTPADSQGFAPHYDDIEAFVLQVEGRKHWKLYGPKSKSEILPRYSSKNIPREELPPLLTEVTLEAGDLLYFPRGTIHEGRTDANSHSLHITVSVYQKTSYADLLEHTLQAALKSAVEHDVEYRQGLPLNYLRHIGFVNSENTSLMRKQILDKAQTLIAKLANYAPFDIGADQMGKMFMWDALPPVVSKHEGACSVREDGERLKDGNVFNRAEISLDLEIRLLRYHSQRLVIEDDNSVRLYHCVDNAKVYHDEEQQFLEIRREIAPAIKYLFHLYPFYTEVELLPAENDTDKLQLVADLWECGLLVTRNPLDTVDDD